MDKDAIVEVLEKKHQELFTWLENQPEDKWIQGPNNRWTMGQHAFHLLKSIKLLNDALSMPRFILRYKYGKNNREVRSYEIVANRYEQKLSENLDRARVFNQKLKTPRLNDKTYILNRLQTENKKLQYKTRKIKDKDLDELILPHPLMGKMPVRELIMWTAHHTEHHTNSLKENY